jgi:hypothetical protein
MILTNNETIFVLWIAGILLSTFFGSIIWVLNKGVNKMDDMAASLNNMERDFKVLVNDHTNLKEDVKGIDTRVRQLEHER